MKNDKEIIINPPQQILKDIQKILTEKGERLPWYEGSPITGSVTTQGELVSFDDEQSTQLFDMTLAELDKQTDLSLNTFKALFFDLTLTQSSKRNALDKLATIANSTSLELQQKAFQTVTELDSFINPIDWSLDYDRRMSQLFGPFTCMTVMDMAREKPFPGGLINGHLSSVVDFNFIIEKRVSQLKSMAVSP